MKRGNFIVFDGLDGSGKSTQAKRLAEYIFDLSKTNSVFLTREPYHSEYYQQIRQTLKSNKNPQDSAELFLELFVKDRHVHLKDIEHCLRQGIHVISDRYKYATLGFQQAQGISLEKLLALHKDMLVPDIVFFIDLATDQILARMEKDVLRKVSEVFEQQKMMELLRQNFLNLPQQLPQEHIVILNGNQEPDQVFVEIKKHIDILFT